MTIMKIVPKPLILPYISDEFYVMLTSNHVISY